MTTPSLLKYANSDFVTGITDIETNEQNAINKTTGQVLTTANFNNVFTPVQVSNMTSDELVEADKVFKSAYKYAAYDFIPIAENAAKNARVGCKTAPEYSNSNNVNLTRTDSAYHTFETCSNKATMLNKKYFSIIKPLPSAGIKDPKLFECHFGNDPLMKATTGTAPNTYYDYVVCWTMGPTVKSFGVDADTGDIIITADNIANMGVKQNKFNTTTTTYTYGNAGTFLPPNSYVSLKTYIFDINQLSIEGGSLAGGWIGRDIPISEIELVDGTNDQYIVAAMDGPYKKMVKVALAIGDNKKYPGIPNDGSLYVKALEAKYSPAYRFVRITATCGGDSWLQISHLQVFNKDGVDVAKGKATSSSGVYIPQTAPANAVNGTPGLKPGYMGYHSNSPCGSWWMVDLGQDTDIDKIVYHNRLDCCRQRIAGAIIQAITSTGEVLYTSVMNTGDVQTFTVSSPSTSATSGTNSSSIPALNKTWKNGIPVTLVGDDTTPGYGVKGIRIRVEPVALGRRAPGYVGQSNSQVQTGQTSLYTLTNVEKQTCETKCDNDPNCLGYTTYGDSVQDVENEPEELGCYRDNWTRAMNTYTGGGRTKDTCLEDAKKYGHKYFGLQYYGQCFTTNDETPGTGYARYGKNEANNCGPLGNAWNNRVYRRNIAKKNVTNCNFYGPNIGTSAVPATGSNIAKRTQTAAPVNNTTLNLTNNALKLDLTQCASGGCKFRLEMGTDGNIKLIRTITANGTTSSSSSGEVLWDLFATDNTVQEKIKKIAPIAQLDWKTAFNNGANNILSLGESLPATKKQMISSNGQFKLEISGGYLQLKAAVYGCFSADQNYKDTKAPMFTNAVENGAQPYYVYQTDISHPIPGNMYYATIGAKGAAFKPVERTNPVIIGTSTYTATSTKYMPYNDTNPNVSTITNIAECQSKCSQDTNCKYLYLKNNTQCMLGNQLIPSYVPVASDSADKYELYLKNSQINTTGVESTIGLESGVAFLPVTSSSVPAYMGPKVEGPQDIGMLATPIGKAIKDRRIDLQGGANKPTNTSLPTKTAPFTYPTSTYASPPKGNTDNTNRFGSFFEGFDPHGWNDPGADCGATGKNDCYAGILYGQIKPLQSIAQDYSNDLNKMNTLYRDISGNIDKYNEVYNVMNNDAQYDFSGSQPIVFSGNTDLNTEMKNDAKQLALQTNNMYIAGSILTTTLLVSAIYLGRS